MIPEIDIWRAAQLMLKRYGDQAEAESTTRAGELEAAGDVLLLTRLDRSPVAR